MIDGHAPDPDAASDGDAGPRTDGEYYTGRNGRLSEMVPARARRILEVGCAAGYLGAWLKAQRADREVVGIELSPDAAAQARVRLDRVLEGDVEAMVEPFAPGTFDCILYGDVLEHLRDPGRVLARHRELLAPDGEMLVCIPNVAHASIFRELLAGRFTYTDKGLLDRTHLRFFTPSSFAELLLAAGLEIRAVEAFQLPDPEMAEALAQLVVVLGIDNPGIAQLTNTFQVIFRAGRSPAGSREQ